MKRLVEETADNSGVWQVVACASANYGKKLEELERLRGEVDGYRSGKLSRGLSVGQIIARPAANLGFSQGPRGRVPVGRVPQAKGRRPPVTGRRRGHLGRLRE